MFRARLKYLVRIWMGILQREVKRGPVRSLMEIMRFSMNAFGGVVVDEARCIFPRRPEEFCRQPSIAAEGSQPELSYGI